MLAILSPSKTLDYESDTPNVKTSKPSLFSESWKLVELMKKHNSQDIKNLMGVSEKLADLNYERYQNFSQSFNESNSKPCIFAFKGDVYEGLDIQSLNSSELQKTNDKIAILSGLYGLLRPFNLMQPYRLEMGISLKNKNGKNLYEFWGNKISEEVNKIENKTLINLASNEYFKSINKKILKAELIDIDFKDDKGQGPKTIGIYAKKARGFMARYLIQNDINKVEDLKNFDVEGYNFSNNLSKEKKLVFLRKH